jgi:hypothetical protein
MPTYLENEGKVRKKTPVAWAVWEPRTQEEVRSSPVLVEMATCDELLQSVRKNVRVKDPDSGEFLIVKAASERDMWIPSRKKRCFLPFSPEPIYQPEDVAAFKVSGYRVITSAENDRYPRGCPPNVPGTSPDLTLRHSIASTVTGALGIGG